MEDHGRFAAFRTVVSVRLHEVATVFRKVGSPPRELLATWRMRLIMSSAGPTFRRTPGVLLGDSIACLYSDG